MLIWCSSNTYDIKLFPSGLFDEKIIQKSIISFNVSLVE